MFEQLLLTVIQVADTNKYWLVQCHLADLLSRMDLNLIAISLSAEKVNRIREKIYTLLMKYLHNEDHRIRQSAAKCLSDFTRGETESDKCWIMRSFIEEKIFACLPVPLNYLYSMPTFQPNDQLKGLLFDLSNNLLEIESRNALLGSIACIKLLLKKFPPTLHYALWAEYKFFPIFEHYLKENATMVFDMGCHADILDIYCHLLAGKAAADATDAPDLTFILGHTLKLINIYVHILTNQKPIFVPPGQKTELFMSDREIQKQNQFGYFCNKAPYMKIYRIVSNVYETYKLDINADVEQKLRGLLRSALKALCIGLEIKPLSSISQSTKLIEEVLAYAHVLLNWDPYMAVEVTKRLYKYFFERNFRAQKAQYELFYRPRDEEVVPETEFIDRVVKFEQVKPGEFFHEEECHLKLFEPMVISSLQVRGAGNWHDKTELHKFTIFYIFSCIGTQTATCRTISWTF